MSETDLRKIVAMAETAFLEIDPFVRPQDRGAFIQGFHSGYTKRDTEERGLQVCKFASLLDGYFLCKSQSECEFQEGIGTIFYCGRSDAKKYLEDHK